MRAPTKAAVIAAAGCASYVLLFPYASDDPYPPVVYNIFGNRIPDDSIVPAFGAAVATLIAVWAAFFLVGKMRSRPVRGRSLPGSRRR